LASAKSRFDGSNNDVSKFYQDFDIGANVGVAYQVTRGVGIDLRYCFGVTRLVNGFYTDEFGNIISEGKTGTNRVFQFGIYYLL
jgi:hypothetical protein